MKAFKVRIDLKYVEQAAKTVEGMNPQLIICGGDSILKPHFITASGANFGLLGLIELDRQLKNWLSGKTTHQKLIENYNQMACLLQKQSNQVILELFGRDLV